MHVILLCALAMTICSSAGLFAKKVGLELGFLRQVGQIFRPLCPWSPNALPIGISSHPIGVREQEVAGHLRTSPMLPAQLMQFFRMALTGVSMW
jgi:hypothetical protein